MGNHLHSERKRDPQRSTRPSHQSAGCPRCTVPPAAVVAGRGELVRGAEGGKRLFRVGSCAVAARTASGNFAGCRRKRDHRSRPGESLGDREPAGGVRVDEHPGPAWTRAGCRGRPRRPGRLKPSDRVKIGSSARKAPESAIPAHGGASCPALESTARNSTRLDIIEGDSVGVFAELVPPLSSAVPGVVPVSVDTAVDLHTMAGDEPAKCLRIAGRHVWGTGTRGRPRATGQ